MKTEHEILEMAFAMFLEKGFSEVSTNELIREAGLTKGGFYYCFKSREDLDQRVVVKVGVNRLFPIAVLEGGVKARSKDRGFQEVAPAHAPFIVSAVIVEAVFQVVI